MFPYRGQKPEIRWSVHMSGGWRTQLDRVRRWHRRASNATDPTDRCDCLYAFFESAFHLRDWLKDTGAVPEAELQNLFETNEDMRLCRDLANSHKHCSLSRPSQSNPPSEVREYSPSRGNLSADVSLMILSDGVKHDAFDIATRIPAAMGGVHSAYLTRVFATAKDARNREVRE
jgi:hypothetical protein